MYVVPMYHRIEENRSGDLSGGVLGASYVREETIQNESRVLPFSHDKYEVLSR